ncbi:hypothetical protein OG936_37995 [Streptomyces sp. NBC_00846]|uniref:hypothetical protein n=1 Tax=Streptomyces sp. NBC_00846 TaxID=2975849 RepID=UPI00386B6149|nr:hypothetical protein OG936_37995 [Streptomyces sp. NBC_00846]
MHKRRPHLPARRLEHGSTASPTLKNWRILTKLRADPARATYLLRALLVLTNLEINR